jgi:hypothetical protein
MVQAIELPFRARQNAITQFVRKLEIALVPKKENFWGIETQSFAHSWQDILVSY